MTLLGKPTKIKMKNFITLLICIFPCVLYSNGGPLDMSHFRKTGNIRLMDKKEVLLKKEDLKIKVIGDFTEIDVNYELQNLGKKQNIQYGFPVDAYETVWGYGDVGNVFSEYNDCIQYFYVYDNEEQIQVSQWIVDNVYKVQAIDLDEGPYHRKNEEYQIVRKWSAVTLEFDENEIKNLRIKYKIKNTLRDKNTGFKFIPRYSIRNFTYDLNPSSNWGNGLVEEFSLKIDLTDLGSSKSIYSLNTKNLSEVEKNVYSKSITNFDLKKASRINISYDNRHLKLTDFFYENEVSKQRIKSINCSSKNKNSLSLIDNLNTTKWNGEKDDWIEIQFKERKENDKSIRGILILDRDYSSKEKFNKSGKLKAVKVIINDKIEFNTEPWEGENGSRIIKLEQKKYKKVNDKDVVGLSTIIADGDGFYENIDTIRIEIVEIEGESVDLFEIYLVGR